MERMKRVAVIAFVLLSCVGCDQVSKTIAGRKLAESGAISFLYGFFRLQYAENPGGFLSLGANTSEDFKYWVFLVLVGLFLAGVLVFLIASRRISTDQTVALSLILGGGVGNLADRIFNDGRVIDFMNVGIGSVRTGVFNVADIAILAGGILLFIHTASKPQEVV